MIKLPKCHVSTIFTCFTFLWPKKKKTPYTPFIHIKGKKKKSRTMLPNVQPEIAQPKAKKQRLQLLEVEKEPKYLGGRERGKIPIT